MIAEAAAGVLGLLGARALAHRAILHGLRAPRVDYALPPAGAPPAPVRELRLDGPGGRRLAAWQVRPPGTAGPVPAVLALHGWGGNAAMMWPLVPPLLDAGWAVLLLDARCHGRSDDAAFASLPRFAEDIATGLTWLRADPGMDAGRLALIGHSVGAAAALLHASRHDDVRAVVSLSAFAHPAEVMRRLLSAHRLPYPVIGWAVLRHVQRVIGARFDAIAPLHTVAHVRCPVLLVHGIDDATVPFDDALRLHRAGPGSRLLAVAGDHDLRQALAPHTAALQDFLAAALGTRPSRAVRQPPPFSTPTPACPHLLQTPP
jgi:pimeloyl-ACP methyl ester carboxylesterase